jgi:hypothetical protein
VYCLVSPEILCPSLPPGFDDDDSENPEADRRKCERLRDDRRVERVTDNVREKGTECDATEWEV